MWFSVAFEFYKCVIACCFTAGGVIFWRCFYICGVLCGFGYAASGWVDCLFGWFGYSGVMSLVLMLLVVWVVSLYSVVAVLW